MVLWRLKAARLCGDNGMGNTGMRLKPTNKSKKADPEEFCLSQQMSLFMSGDDDPRASNTIELYDVMPKYSWARSRVKEDLDNSLVTRRFKLRSCTYIARIKPALVSRKVKGKDKNVLIYPSQREELVEDALRKLAYNGGGIELDEHAGVLFTMSQLRRELESVGHTFSLDEILEALEVLGSAILECWPETSDDDGDIIRGSYLTSMYLTRRKDYLEGPKDAKCYVTFHPLVTLSIRSQTYRLFDYEKSMAMRSELARHMYKRMSHYFTQAASDKSYDFHLTTFLEATPRGRSSRMKTDLKSLRNAIQVLVDNKIVLDYREDIVKDPNDRRVTKDAYYSLTPHPEFVRMVIKANAHQRSIREQAEHLKLVASRHGSARQGGAAQ